MYPVDQRPNLWVYYEDVGGDPVMTFHSGPYSWILMKIRNFQCSDITYDLQQNGCPHAY